MAGHRTGASEGRKGRTALRSAKLIVDRGGVMDKAALQALQAPLKERYRDDPDGARITLSAEGSLGEENVSCSVATGRAMVEAGLHPATGGDGMLACSGDMLLQALVACA